MTRIQPRTRQRAQTALPALLLTLSLAFLAGCGHRSVAYTPPPPPGSAPAYNGYPSQPAENAQPTVGTFPGQPNYGSRPSAGLTADQQFVDSHRPIYTETGIASWYGPLYNHHRAADGSVYHQNDLSAAHRTLPLGSIVKVTNLRTGQSAVMRITDRGPFIPGRIIDLSAASARAVGLYRAGIGRVRVSVYYSPEPLDYGGRWAVQIGAFQSKRAAVKLERRLQRKYPAASVIEFKGPTGDWVRIRPDAGNREIAMHIARTLQPRQGAAFLVRLN
jgi:rare lipoprotein A